MLEERSEMMKMKLEKYEIERNRKETVRKIHSKEYNETKTENRRRGRKN